MSAAQPWFSCRDKQCTYCGGELVEHTCNCCSCNRKGHHIAWRCGNACRMRSKRYADRKATGDSAATAWAQHRNHGVFCSKKCHDADARRQRDEAFTLEIEYQWLTQGKELVRAANARLRVVKGQAPCKAVGVQRASRAPGVASGARKTFAI